MSQEVTNNIVNAVQDNLIPAIQENLVTATLNNISNLPNTTNVTPTLAPTIPTTTLIENTTNLDVMNITNEGYLDKMKNYFKTMSNKNFYIVLVVLVLVIITGVYYIWTKFISRKKNNNLKNMSKDAKMQTDGRGFRDLRDPINIIAPRDVRDPRDARDPRDVRDMRDQSKPRNINHRSDDKMINEKNKSDKSNRSNKSNKSNRSNRSNKSDVKEEKKDTPQIFSNEYQEIYANESSEHNNHGNSLLNEIPNYDPENATNN